MSDDHITRAEHEQALAEVRAEMAILRACVQRLMETAPVDEHDRKIAELREKVRQQLRPIV